MRDSDLSAEARLARLERKIRKDLRYVGYPAPPEAKIEDLLKLWKGAMADLMRPRGRRG